MPVTARVPNFADIFPASDAAPRGRRQEHQTSSCNLLRPEYWLRRCDPEGSLGGQPKSVGWPKKKLIIHRVVRCVRWAECDVFGGLR